jgi:hypothetical protein
VDKSGNASTIATEFLDYNDPKKTCILAELASARQQQFSMDRSHSALLNYEAVQQMCKPVWQVLPFTKINMLNCYSTLDHLHERKLNVEHTVSSYDKGMTVSIAPEELTLSDMLCLLTPALLKAIEFAVELNVEANHNLDRGTQIQSTQDDKIAAKLDRCQVLYESEFGPHRFMEPLFGVKKTEQIVHDIGKSVLQHGAYALERCCSFFKDNNSSKLIQRTQDCLPLQLQYAGMLICGCSQYIDAMANYSADLLSSIKLSSQARENSAYHRKMIEISSKVLELEHEILRMDQDLTAAQDELHFTRENC